MNIVVNYFSSRNFEETHPHSSWRRQRLQMWLLWQIIYFCTCFEKTYSHSSWKPCESCSKSFSLAMYLKKHIHIVHKGHKDYKCESCGKSFSKAGDLKRHIHIDHKCKTCGKVGALWM